VLASPSLRQNYEIGFASLMCLCGRFAVFAEGIRHQELVSGKGARRKDRVSLQKPSRNNSKPSDPDRERNRNQPALSLKL